MMCDNCGEDVQVVRVINKKSFCDKCVYEVRPPVLILTILTEEPGMLFNPKTGKFEQDIKQMKNLCNFHLFSQKTFRPPYSAQQKHKEIFTYRYRGACRCNKFPEYKGWPLGMPQCKHFPNKAPLCMHKTSL